MTRSGSSRAGARRPATRPTPPPWRGCATSTRSSTRCCATARSRSSAPPMARTCWPRWPRTAGSTRRSARRSPAPAGSHLSGPTSTTSRCAPTRGGGSAASSSRHRVSSSWWPTTTRSSCGCWPTWPPTRGSSMRSRPAPTSTARWPRGCSGCRWTRSPGRSGSGPRWSPTASPTAWRRTAWLGGSRRASRRRPRSWPATSGRSRPCGRTWTTPWSRPGTAATPGPPSGASGRSPS